MKKIYILVIFLLLLSGCSKSDLKKYYENMSIKFNKIQGYKLDLRIVGNTDKIIVNKTIKISNFRNTDYEISTANIIKNMFDAFKNGKTALNDNYDKIYIINNKVYEEDENLKLVKSSKKLSSIKYRNPNTYLEGLINVKKVKKIIDLTILKEKYKVYDVIVNKKYISKIVTDTGIKFEGKKDCSAKIYIDKYKRVNKIIYTIEGITITATYYDINIATEIAISNN
ncbi:MAG TPA: hypothetical protein PKY25_03395 [Bacilli bacterium]|nr:hypothetical protein [Bacilli bacterium]